MKFNFDGSNCKIGQKVQLGAAPNVYIIASAGSNKVVLIDIDTGHRWEDPIVVEDMSCITKEEWKELTSYCYDDYKIL